MKPSVCLMQPNFPVEVVVVGRGVKQVSTTTSNSDKELISEINFEGW